MIAPRSIRRFARVSRLSMELLAAHALRTALSVSGIVVGVATIMVMVSFGKGAEQRILDRVRALGSDVVIVTTPPAARVAGRQRQVATATALRQHDATAIVEGTPYAVLTAAAVQQNLVVRWNGRNATLPIFGTTTDGLRIRRITARTGRSFDEEDERGQRRVALVGERVVQTLFAGADPVGLEIRVGAVPFEVIGVTTPRGTDIGGTDLDAEVIVPLAAAMRRVLNIPYVHSIYAQAAGAGELDRLEADVRAILLERHPPRIGLGLTEPFVVQNQAVLMRTHRGTSRAIGRMVGAVGSLSLIVGGVGIAAVMLLSLRERTREIGLRRAVGARRADIRAQLLIEGSILAVSGATAGVALGFLVATVGAGLGQWPLVFSWPAAAAGIAVSALSGLVAGVIPARRALRLEPVAALRS